MPSGGGDWRETWIGSHKGGGPREREASVCVGWKLSYGKMTRVKRSTYVDRICRLGRKTLAWCGKLEVFEIGIEMREKF